MMAFMISVLLFVPVLGWLDSKLPWPSNRERG